MIRDLMLLGMDVARLNFSHGTHDQHADSDRAVAQGGHGAEPQHLHPAGPAGPQDPYWTTEFNTPVALKKGQTVTITPKDVVGTTEIISTTYQNLATM